MLRFYASNLDATLPSRAGQALGMSLNCVRFRHATRNVPPRGKPERYLPPREPLVATNPMAVGDRETIMGAVALASRCPC